MDEAYVLAKEQMAAPEAGDRDLGDLAWCLIALVNRHAGGQDEALFRRYLQELSDLEVPRDNELLVEKRQQALDLAAPDRRQFAEARQFSKQGQSSEAISVYLELLKRGALRLEDKRSLGWELYKANKAIFQASQGHDLLPKAIDQIKRNLSLYLKLAIGESDLLHTLILQQAERLAKGEHLRLIVFAKLWDLSLLRSEDYHGSTSSDGKVYPALFEAVVQRAAKEALTGGSAAELEFIQPYLATALEKYPENVWLRLSMVKLLRATGKIDDARALGAEFARTKATEFWAWDLVGDLAEEDQMRLSCYAKALTCSDDDAFVQKVRLKFAALIAREHPGQAKAEVERVIAHRHRAGQRIPAEAERMMRSTWFADTEAQTSGRPFYAKFVAQAEELLFAHLPWLDACVGDQFVIKGVDGQKDRSRRRIYVRSSPLPSEVSISASHPDLRRLTDGSPVKIQMERNSHEQWKVNVHRIIPRLDGEPDDVLCEEIGLINHVNTNAKVMHVVVRADVHGTFPLASYCKLPQIGDVVSLRLARYRDRKGVRTRVVSASPSSKPAPSTVLKSFCESVKVSNGMGFTDTGIFIPPDLVTAARIDEDAGNVEGTAILNFNKKRNSWGWKAIKAKQ